MRKGNVFITLGLLLIAAALALVGFNLWDNQRADRAAQDFLEQLVPALGDDPIPAEGRPVFYGGETPEAFGTEEAEKSPDSDAVGAERIPDDMEYPDYVLDPGMDMPVVNVRGEDYIGVLSIPALGKVLPVCAEWDYDRLNSAPCRYSGTVYMSNMVICAHNYDSHFGDIKNLRYGDTVEFTDGDGNYFCYAVSEIETLRPADIERMTSGDWDLTLFTCTIGGQTRVTVRCTRCQ